MHVHIHVCEFTHLYMCVHMPGQSGGGQRTTLMSWFCPSTMDSETQAQVKCLYQRNHSLTTLFL